MWWGVGVGKTCGATSIAEQYKSKVSDRFSLKKNFSDNIWGYNYNKLEKTNI